MLHIFIDKSQEDIETDGKRRALNSNLHHHAIRSPPTTLDC